jgi:glycosyltransferase involved in cell wall biosynthesis
MQVVYILPISWGAIPHYTAGLANAVSKYADVVVLKPKDSNDNLFSKDVEVINAFKPMYFSRKHKIKAFSLINVINFFSFGNVKLVDKIRPEIIHFPELYPQSSIFTFLYRIHRKYPIVSTLHATFDSPSHLLNLKSFTYGTLASITEFTKGLVKSDRIIVHTQKNKNTLIKRGVNHEKIAVVPHGAYTFLKKYGKDEAAEDEGNYVLFFGYIVKNKGIEYLAKCAPIISEEVPNIKVIVAGEGDLLGCKALMDDSRFEIHNEFIPNEKVAELFQRAKVVVLPYTYHQGHSGVLTIAFAFGKPVIVTNVGDLPNLVKDGKEGLIVPPKDPKALAGAIIKLLKDDELRREMGENALKKAEELSWDNIAKMHMKVYEEVLVKRNDKR